MSLRNARSYRVHLNLSPLDFPAIMGLGESSISYASEPVIINNNLLLMIAYTFVLLDMNTNKQHNVFTAQSIYEITPREIETRDFVYDFYKDALLGLNEAYQFARSQTPGLFNIEFPTPPIEDFQKEIDRVFDVLNSQN